MFVFPTSDIVFLRSDTEGDGAPSSLLVRATVPNTPPSPAGAHGTGARGPAFESVEQEQALVARRLGYRNARIGPRRRRDRAGDRHYRCEAPAIAVGDRF
jgi:hypothetical protein